MINSQDHLITAAVQTSEDAGFGQQSLSGPDGFSAIRIDGPAHLFQRQFNGVFGT